MITGMGVFKKKIYCQESMYSTFEGKLLNSSLSITNGPPICKLPSAPTPPRLYSTSHAHFLLRSLYKDRDRKSELQSVLTQLGSRLRSSGDVAPVQTFTLKTEAAGSSVMTVLIGYKTRHCKTTE